MSGAPRTALRAPPPPPGNSVLVRTHEGLRLGRPSGSSSSSSSSSSFASASSSATAAPVLALLVRGPAAGEAPPPTESLREAIARQLARPSSMPGSVGAADPALAPRRVPGGPDVAFDLYLPRADWDHISLSVIALDGARDFSSAAAAAAALARAVRIGAQAERAVALVTLPIRDGARFAAFQTGVFAAADEAAAVAAASSSAPAAAQRQPLLVVLVAEPHAAFAAEAVRRLARACSKDKAARVAEAFARIAAQGEGRDAAAAVVCAGLASSGGGGGGGGAGAAAHILLDVFGSLAAVAAAPACEMLARATVSEAQAAAIEGFFGSRE